MDALQSYCAMAELLGRAAGELRLACRVARARGWLVLVASADDALALALPTLKSQVRGLPRERVVASAVPTEQVIRALPALGPGGDLADLAHEIGALPMVGPPAIVVAHRGHVMLLRAGPEASLEILGMART